MASFFVGQNFRKKLPLLPLVGLLLLLLLIPVTVFRILKFENTIKKPQAATGYPSGFVETQVASGLTAPTSMEVAPDGRIFVAEQGGKLRIVKNNSLLPTPFVTVSIRSGNERGLLGVTLDPNFQTNRYVYVFYTDPDSSGNCGTSSAHSRVSRFRASATNPDVAEAGETVIFDLSPLDCNENHNGGGIHFGNDGKLYIASGDNRTPSRAQVVTNTHGKILRVNPDGTIPSDNPTSFVTSNGTLTPTGNMRAIWALGLRNPFTFGVDPICCKIYVNDVGEGSFEEVNDLVKGANYGWGAGCEGQCSINDAIYKDPLYAYGRSVGASVTGGAFYRATQFPTAYRGDYFFSDYVTNWIKRLDENGNIVSGDFASNANAPVDIDVGPDGSLYFLSIGNGRLYKVTYGAPNAVATANPITGNAPLTVSFSGSGSSDPNGSVLTYSWDFGDGSSPGTGVNVSHTYTSNGLYQAVLTATNTSGVSGVSTPITIQVGSIGTIDFNNKATGTLNGEYPTGVVNWGSTAWEVSGPWGQFSDNNLGFRGSTITSGNFSWVGSSKRLLRLDAYNGGGGASTVTISCSGNTTKTQSVSAGQRISIQTNWTNVCGTVTLSSSNGWDTNFDNLVYDAGGGTANQPPTATIITPTSGTLFNYGDTISFSGDGNDPEDGALPASAFSWTIVFHHDTHTHPFRDPPFNDGAKAGSFVANASEVSANIWYRIHLKVTDSQGLSTTVTRDVTPRKVNLTFNTSPANLQIALDTLPLTTPAIVQGVVNFPREVSPILSQGGKTYQFVSWSDGGAATHTITTPSTNTTYTATYTTSSPLGDIDTDGDVDIFDLSGLISLWGGSNAEADLNDNGKVDIWDLSILLSNWTG